MKKAAVLLFFLTSAAASAQSYGTGPAVFLMDDISASVFSDGGLTLPLPNDPSAAYLNPAALGRMENSALSFSLWRGPDQAGLYSFFTGVLRTRDSGVFGFSYQGYSSGQEEIYDLNGNEKKLTLQSDLAASAAWGGEFADNFYLGGKIKFINSSLVEKYTAQTVAFDLGILVKLDKKLTASFSAENLNGSLKYKNSPEPLTRNLRFEMARRDYFSYGIMNAGMGVKKEDAENTINILGGGEWEFRNFPLALRCGARHGAEGFFFNAGLGLSWKNFSMDYGIQFPQSLGASLQRISLSLAFENPEQKKKSRKNSKKSGKSGKNDYWGDWFILPK